MISRGSGHFAGTGGGRFVICRMSQRSSGVGWPSIAGLSIQKMLFEGVSMSLEGQGADVRFPPIVVVPRVRFRA